MATLALTIKDATYAAMLATFPDEAELKRFVRQALKDRVIAQRTREEREASNAALRKTLAALDAALEHVSQ